MFTYEDDKLYIGQISFFIFKLIGIYQPVTCNTRWRIYLYNVYSIFTLTNVFIMVVSLFIYMTENVQTIESELETFFYFLCFSNILYKMISVSTQHQTMDEFKILFLNKHCQSRDNFELKILQRTSNSCR